MTSVNHHNQKPEVQIMFRTHSILAFVGLIAPAFILLENPRSVLADDLNRARNTVINISQASPPQASTTTKKSQVEIPAKEFKDPNRNRGLRITEPPSPVN